MADKIDKLYITLTDNRGQGGIGGASGKPTSSSQSIKTEQNNSSAILRYAEHELFHIIKGTSIKTVNFATSNYANFTGDYIMQKDIYYVKDVASNITNVAFSTFAGAKMGGVVGMAAGFVVGASSIVVGGIFNDISNRLDNTKANYNIAQLRERAGLNSIYDGSRGTEN